MQKPGIWDGGEPVGPGDPTDVGLCLAFWRAGQLSFIAEAAFIWALLGANKLSAHDRRFLAAIAGFAFLAIQAAFWEMGRRAGLAKWQIVERVFFSPVVSGILLALVLWRCS